MGQERELIKLLLFSNIDKIQFANTTGNGAYPIYYGLVVRIPGSHLGFGFPCKPGSTKFQRLNDVRNNEKMKGKMMNPVLKSVKSNNNPNPVP
jgi:hypothetical protein